MARIEYEDEDADDAVHETPRWRRRAVTAVLAVVGLGLGFLIPYTIYLNQQISERFGELRWQVPTRVYARPLQLAPGVTMNAATLKTELDAAGYREDDGVKPGTYSIDGGRWTISSRGFRDVDGVVGAGHVVGETGGDQQVQHRRAGADARPATAEDECTAGRTSDPVAVHIDHVGVAVPDLDAAIAFYRDTYGMELAHEEVNEEQGVREAMMKVGSSGSCIQLLAPLTPESTIAKFLDRNGSGIQQLAYRVEDIDAVGATLRERGLRLLYDTPKGGTAGSRVNFIHPKDAGGILVELVEPSADGH